jgi:hypothetical protein
MKLEISHLLLSYIYKDVPTAFAKISGYEMQKSKSKRQIASTLSNGTWTLREFPLKTVNIV